MGLACIALPLRQWRGSYYTGKPLPHLFLESFGARVVYYGSSCHATSRFAQSSCTSSPPRFKSGSVLPSEQAPLPFDLRALFTNPVRDHIFL